MSEQSRSGPGRFQISAPRIRFRHRLGLRRRRLRHDDLLLLGCGHRLLAGFEFGLLRGLLLGHPGLFRRDLVQVGS
jgi:hypothetical protein